MNHLRKLLPPGSRTRQKWFTMLRFIHKKEEKGTITFINILKVKNKIKYIPLHIQTDTSAIFQDDSI